MSYILNRSRFFAVSVTVAILSAIMFFGLTQTVNADQRGFRAHEFVDSRYNHNHSYPYSRPFR